MNIKATETIDADPKTGQAPDDQLWDINDVAAYRKRSKASIYIDIKAGRHDPGILITPRCRRWLPSKVRVKA